MRHSLYTFTTIFFYFMVAAFTAGYAAPRGLFEYSLQFADHLHLDLKNFIGPDALSSAELADLAKTSQSYDEFLQFLHHRAPYLFENYVLLHATGSIQHASKEAPRVILFGDGLMIAFDEKPGHSTKKVEVIAFNEQNFSFSFQDIRFPGDKEPVVDPNPASCAACHGAPGKPIWEAYDFWPNAYGSAISRFYSAEEQAAYDSFIRSPRAGIYSYLKDHRRDSGRALESIEALTLYISNLNFLAASSQLNLRSAEMSALKYALYGALGECTAQQGLSFESFFPPETFASASFSYASLLQSTKTERQRYRNYLSRVYSQRFPGYREIFRLNHERLASEVTQVAQIRFIFENIGLNLSSLHTSSGFNRYFMSTPANFGPDWRTALAVFDRQDMLAAGASITKSSSGSGVSWVHMNCGRLQALSLERLAGFRFSAQKPQPPQISAPVAHCISCHTKHGPSRAPAIPFDDTAKLRELFVDRPEMKERIRKRIRMSGPGQMPPYKGLSEAEIRAFDAFLDDIQ